MTKGWRSCVVKVVKKEEEGWNRKEIDIFRGWMFIRQGHLIGRGHVSDKPQKYKGLSIRSRLSIFSEEKRLQSKKMYLIEMCVCMLCVRVKYNFIKIFDKLIHLNHQ